MKKLTFVVQSKGGAGKSALTYLLANKYKDNDTIMFVDMDNETKTSSLQLAFAHRTMSHNLIDDNTKNIDRAGFDKFFEEFINGKTITSAVCDMGGTSSEQFLIFLKNDGGADMLEALISMNVEVQVLCVVAGMNAFPSSSNYCRDLFKELSEISLIQKVIIKNNFNAFTEEQNSALVKLSKATKSIIEEFNIVPNNVPGTLAEVHGLMEQGKPLSDAKTFTKIRLKKSIDNCSISI